MTLRDKKRQKKESILKAAAKVFASSGFYDAKIAKIAELAGVGAGSIYLYYQNKQHMLDEILNNFWKGLCEGIEKLSAAKGLDQVEKLTRVIETLFDTLVEDSSITKIFIHVNSMGLWSDKVETNPYFTRFFDIAKTMIEEGQAQGFFPKQLNAGLTLHFVSGGIRDILHQWAVSEEEIPLDTIRNNIIILSKHGVLHPDDV